MFGRATIRLGIGPHSSVMLCYELRGVLKEHPYHPLPTPLSGPLFQRSTILQVRVRLRVSVSRSSISRVRLRV